MNIKLECGEAVKGTLCYPRVKGSEALKGPQRSCQPKLLLCRLGKKIWKGWGAFPWPQDEPPHFQTRGLSRTAHGPLLTFCYIPRRPQLLLPSIRTKYQHLMHTSFLMDPIDRISPWGIKVDPYSCFYLNTFCIIFSNTEEQYASPVQKPQDSCSL